jgi:hypothetical protein
MHAFGMRSPPSHYPSRRERPKAAFELTRLVPGSGITVLSRHFGLFPPGQIRHAAGPRSRRS